MGASKLNGKDFQAEAKIIGPPATGTTDEISDGALDGQSVRVGEETAFDRARLLAHGQNCDQCDEFMQYPEGVALYEELYCEDKWFCRECYPESELNEVE